MFGIGVQEVRRTTKTFNVKGRLERHQRIVERTYAVCCLGGPANQMQPKILDSLMEGDVSVETNVTRGLSMPGIRVRDTGKIIVQVNFKAKNYNGTKRKIDDLYQFRQKRGVTQTRGVFTAATNEAEKG